MDVRLFGKERERELLQHNALNLPHQVNWSEKFLMFVLVYEFDYYRI